MSLSCQVRNGTGGLSIRYPREGGLLTSGECEILVRAEAAARVEVCVDGGLWQACRFRRGVWSCGWSGCPSGEHLLVARMLDRQRRWFASPQRRFRVALEAGDFSIGGYHGE